MRFEDGGEVGPSSCTHIRIQNSIVNYNVHVPRNRNVFIFIISKPTGNVKGPMNPSFLTLDAPKYPNEIKKHATSLFENVSWKFRILEIAKR